MNDPRLQALHGAIVQQEKGAIAEDILVPSHTTDLLKPLSHLYQATKICLQQLAGASVEQVARTKTAALEIFGLLTGLAIDRDRLSGSAGTFDPWQGDFEITLPLGSEAMGVVHYLGRRTAKSVLGAAGKIPNNVLVCSSSGASASSKGLLV